MDRESFLKEAARLREQGKSIRAIASALDASPSRVYRALRAVRLGSDRVFVGRQTEIGKLRGALQESLVGRERITVLSGEPGIGKTRTAEEIGASALQRGARVMWGRCYEGQGAPPYWPWVQIVRDYVRDREAGQLSSDMGAGAADIAEIVPELGEKLPNLKPPTSLDSAEANRFRLFDSITTFLKYASRSQPLVLVLEDLH